MNVSDPTSGRGLRLPRGLATLGLSAFVLGGMFTLGGSSLLASAPDPEAVKPPTRNRVWAGCTLSSTAVDKIKYAIRQGANIDDDNVQVGFIVVYTLDQVNDGQPLTTGGTTGPVICRPPYGIEVETTNEQEDLPNESDHGPYATSVDLLDVEEALVLRYRVNAYGEGDPIEKRFCHTLSSTAGAATQPPETNVDCFRIFPGNWPD